VKTVTITPSLKEIETRIKKVIDDADARRRVLIRAVLELKDRAAAYPPEGAWNKAPGTKGNNIWYQRQFGTRWLKKDGTFGGRNESQRLQKSWQTEVQREDTFTASAFTGVTYAPLLLDPAEQVSWAPTHGWKNLDEIAEGYQPRFVALVLEEVDNQIDKL
jgi:hypothetical protein